MCVSRFYYCRTYNKAVRVTSHGGRLRMEPNRLFSNFCDFVSVGFVVTISCTGPRKRFR